MWTDVGELRMCQSLQGSPLLLNCYWHCHDLQKVTLLNRWLPCVHLLALLVFVWLFVLSVFLTKSYYWHQVLCISRSRRWALGLKHFEWWWLFFSIYAEGHIAGFVWREPNCTPRCRNEPCNIKSIPATGSLGCPTLTGYSLWHGQEWNFVAPTSFLLLGLLLQVLLQHETLKSKAFYFR